MTDKQEEWFRAQMAREQISPRSKRAPSTVTGSLVVAKRSGSPGYIMRIHTRASATTVEKNFADEMAAYNEGMERLGDIMSREANLRGRSEFAIYRQGRLVRTEVVEVDLTEVDLTEVDVTPEETTIVETDQIVADVYGSIEVTLDEAESSGEQLVLGLDFIEDPMVATRKTEAGEPCCADEPCCPDDKACCPEDGVPCPAECSASPCCDVDAIAGHEIAGQLSFMDETVESTVKLVDKRFEDDSIVVTFEAIAESTLWRKIGDSDGTRKLRVGKNEVSYKIADGEGYEFRLGTEDGTVLDQGEH